MKTDGEWLVDDFSRSRRRSSEPPSPSLVRPARRRPRRVRRARSAPPGRPRSPTSTPPTAGSGCSTRPPRCCSTRSGGRRTTPSWRPRSRRPTSRSPSPRSAAEPRPDPEPVATPTGAAARWVVPTWLLVGARRADRRWSSPRRRTSGPSPRTARSRSRTRAAQSAAERAIVPVLSYDYRDPRRRPGRGAGRTMTVGLPQGVRPALRGHPGERARRPGPSSSAEVVASGIVRVRRGPGRGAAVREPADDQQAADRAGRLQEPGPGHHGAGRRTTGWSTTWRRRRSRSSPAECPASAGRTERECAFP